MRRVADVMLEPVVIESSATIQEASARMLDEGAHAVLVVRDGAVWGVATAAGVSKALAEGHSAAETPVEMITDRAAPMFDPDEALADAHQIMRAQGRPVAAVVDSKGEPLGIVWDDEVVA